MFQKVGWQLYSVEYKVRLRQGTSLRYFTLHTERLLKRTFPRFRFHVFFTYDNAQASSEASTIKLSCMLSCYLLLVAERAPSTACQRRSRAACFIAPLFACHEEPIVIRGICAQPQAGARPPHAAPIYPRTEDDDADSQPEAHAVCKYHRPIALTRYYALSAPCSADDLLPLPPFCDLVDGPPGGGAPGGPLPEAFANGTEFEDWCAPREEAIVEGRAGLFGALR
jgi:hypothetical protein